MGAMLDALHRLQGIESQLRSVREQINSKRNSVNVQQRRTANIQRQITDLHDQMRHAQTESDRMELDRKTQEAHQAKLRETLNKTKTNKEYAAILTQLNTEKADTVKLEDAVLTAMSKVDELKKEEATLRANLEKEQSRLVELEKAAADVANRLSSKLKDFEAQREEGTAGISAEVLNVFERACDAHDGEAMAIIEQSHPKREEFTCSGCNMSITLETINALQSRDAIQQCQTCSRILYLDSPAHVTA